VRKSQIFAVIDKLCDKYSICQMCEFYNVSRRGFYDFKKRQNEENPDKELIDAINECHTKHKRRYGYRRLSLWLKQEKGILVNKKKSLRVTSRNNLLSVIRRRKLFKYKLNGNIRYENILNRDFYSEKPNEKWVTDISYIIVPEGTLYLSAIRDLCGNFVVAYKTAKQQDYSLIRNTINQAITYEKPNKSLILHSDGGGQYR